MVDAVAGRAALASLTGTFSADQTGNRKNPLLPTPLNASQQRGGQRASPILKFDIPQLSSDVFKTLQNNALLNATRTVTTREERVRLEAEINQRIQVVETGGSPGSPGTPDIVDIVQFTEGTLNAQALNDLQKLLDKFKTAAAGDFSDSRLVTALREDLQDFAQRLNSGQAEDVLGEIIGRIENSVIGQGGLEFRDIFRDPALFITIGIGLAEFGADTNNRASDALRDIILRIGDWRFSDSNPRNDFGALQRISSAIDRLGRALGDEQGGVAALDRFLDRLQAIGAGGNGGGNSYAGRIAGVLDDALNDIRGGSLDLEAIQRLQRAKDEITALENVAGTADDLLRASAAEGIDGLLSQYASITTREQTTVTPGQPAIPAVPGERTVNIIEETTFVPKVEVIERVVTIYQGVQDTLKPLQKLAEQPPPVPSLQALVTPPVNPERDGEDGKRKKGIVIGADDEDDGRRRSGFGGIGRNDIPPNPYGLAVQRSGFGLGVGQQFNSLA